MKIGLLLGAGFSFDLGMPIAKELTEVFLGLFNERNVKSLVRTMSDSHPYSANRPINGPAIAESFDSLLSYKSANGQNYEEMLSRLQALAETHSRSQSDKDSFHFVFGFLYEVIHDILSLYQLTSYEILYSKNLQWFSSLENLLSEQETWAFSLNHDLYLECLAIDLKIPISYGDSQSKVFPVSNLEMAEKVRFSCGERSNYNADSPGFIHGRKGINLVKLHGGLSEYDYDDKKIICNLDLNRTSSQELLNEYGKVGRMANYQNGVTVRTTKDRFITNEDGQVEVIGKAMLTGGQKYSTTAKPEAGEEKLTLFDRILGDVDQLTVIGYGLGDKHVNFRISNAMARRDGLTLWIVDPHRNKLPDFLEPFDYDSRVRRASCGAALWMDYCKTNRWRAEQMEGLKENEKIREIIKDKVKEMLHSRAGARRAIRN
jgi:hypothetical protein